MLSKITISKMLCVALVVASALVLNFAMANTKEEVREKKAVPHLGPPYN